MKALLLLMLCMLEPLEVKGEARNVSSYFSRPKSVNIGALFTFNSVIGRAAKPAIAAAIDDINSDSSILPGTKLNLIFHDTNCSGFLGIMEALQLMEKDVAVAIGPQSSGIAHVISDVANELHVPLLSLATDPTLSALQYPYFLRVTQSDYFQMYAIADLVSYNGWSEVIAIHVDDDYGRNGVSELGDALASKRTKISYKAAFSPSASTNDISNLLGEVNLMESPGIVVHVNPDSGLTIFSVANSFSPCVGLDGRGRISFGDKGNSDQDETPVNVKHLNPTYNINMTQLSVGTNVTDVNFTAIMDSGPSFTVLSGAAYTTVTESFNAQVKEKRHAADSQFAFEYCYDLSSCENGFETSIVYLTMNGGSPFYVTDPILFVTFSTNECMYCLAVEQQETASTLRQRLQIRSCWENSDQVLSAPNFEGATGGISRASPSSSANQLERPSCVLVLCCSTVSFACLATRRCSFYDTHPTRAQSKTE